MSPLSPIELAICLIPAVIVIIIAVIVVDAIRRKPTKTTENNLQADSQTSSGTGDVSRINSSTETAVNSQNGLATTSLVISILAIIVLVVPILLGQINNSINFSNCMGPLAMIMGAISLLQIRKHGGKGKGIAIAGIVLGTLPFLITLGTILLIAVREVNKVP